jgi:hypothetical protein
MATKARLDWFWRGAIAVAAALAFSAINTLMLLSNGPVRSLGLGLRAQLEPWTGLIGAQVLTGVIMDAVPLLAVGFGTYGLTTWAAGQRVGDGETHCRQCGYILRGLSEPRCPECGEAI